LTREASRQRTETRRILRGRCRSTLGATAQTSNDRRARWPVARAGQTASESSVPAVALVHPVAALHAERVAHAQPHDVLGLLVAKFGRQHETQRRPVLTRQWAAVHLIAQERLPVTRGGHVERLVVVVSAHDLD